MDQYRVKLFKDKIKSLFPDIEKVRLVKSMNGSDLVFYPGDYKKESIVSDIFIKRLSRNQINFYLDNIEWGLKVKVFKIKIPIDQEALPERKRVRI